jgi:hypothetical protein
LEKNRSIGFKSGEYLGRKKGLRTGGVEVAWTSGRDKNTFDVNAEALAVDRSTSYGAVTRS